VFLAGKIEAMSRYTLEDFNETLSFQEPPEEMNNLLQALWFNAKGDWETAHELIQSVYTTEGAWVHAYMHRKEGDMDKAAHWYKKAGKIIPDNSFEEEWLIILAEFLD
jgi:tetratricopeptide (TPR) repeat protein